MRLLSLIAAALMAPTAVEPQDDPQFEHCLVPGEAIQLRWTMQQEPGVSTWLVIKRKDPDGEWRPWVSTYVKGPPFSLNMRSRASRNGDFAWALFAVDRDGQDYVMGDWSYFCTRG